MSDRIARTVVVSGVGHLSKAGASLPELRQTLFSPKTIVTDLIADKYITFKAPPVDLAQLKIARREQRFLGPLMKLATAASHEALSHALLIDDVEALETLDLILACGAGVRDEAQDHQIVHATRGSEDQTAAIENLLSSRLRPTEFLTQLPNLAAANICIFFGIKGSTRTLMGGESAGMHALKMAFSKIANGSVDRILVGGASYGQCFYSNLALAQAGALKTTSDGLVALGSAATFLLLEAQESAQVRGVDASIILEPIIEGRKNAAASGRKVSSQVDEKTVRIRIADLPREADKSRNEFSKDILLTSLIGSTREESIFGGVAAAYGYLEGSDLTSGLVALQHRNASDTQVILRQTSNG